MRHEAGGGSRVRVVCDCVNTAMLLMVCGCVRACAKHNTFHATSRVHSISVKCASVLDLLGVFRGVFMFKWVSAYSVSRFGQTMAAWRRM